MAAEKRLWMVAYDVACPRRWRGVFRLLKSWGGPVQYSVFACRLSDAELRDLAAGLEELLDAAEDRAHIWPVCGQCEARVRVLGRGGRMAPLPAAWVISDE